MTDPTTYPYETHLDILHGPLERIDVPALVDAVRHPWYNQTLCKVNDSVVRLGVVQGEYHWHKHDTEDPPREAKLEELYYYRFAKPQGYAVARVYTPDRRLDAVMAPMDGDLVLVPEGYHPVGAAAGYDCYYLNIMAGPNRAWHFTIDPDHQWLMDWSPAAPKPAT